MRWARTERLHKMARLARAATSLAFPLRPWIANRGRGSLVQVENTSYCNFRCAYCVTHSPSSLVPLKRGHMSMSTFTGILDANPAARIVVIQGDGEPLMDPTVFDKLALARDRGLATQIISNGSLLTDKMIARLCAEGPDMFLVSLDAVSAETNEKNRTGLDHAKVTAAVTELCARRGSTPRVVGLLSVVHGEFTQETAAALHDFDRLGIDILFYKQLNRAFEGRIDGYRGGRAEGVPASVRRALSYPVSHQRISTITPCPQLRFRLPYYLWDGSQTACCILNSAQYAAPEFQHDALLARYAARKMPAECESCSYFAGYA